MIDWDTCIKPLLSGPIASPPATFTAENLKAIIQAVNANAEKILEHESAEECFYSCFVALSGHYMATSLDQVPKSLYRDFVSSCKTLLKFCLSRMLNFDVQCAVPQKNLMQMISSLCLGNNMFVRGDLITFTAMLKSATMPMIVVKQNAESASEASSSKTCQTSNPIEQMSMTFELYYTGISMTGSNENVDKSVLLKANSASLSELTEKQSLDQIYQNLPYLRRYFNRVCDQKQGKPLILPHSQSAAVAVRNGVSALSSNINIICQVISLPISEPVTLEKIDNLSKLGLSCLYAGLSVAAAMTIISKEEMGGSTSGTSSGKFSKEPDYESIAENIISDVVDVYHGIEATFSSDQMSPSVLPNFRMAASVILSQGLPVILEKDKDDEETLRAKKQPSINPLTVALTVVLTESLKNLLQDCSHEHPELLQAENTSGSLPDVLNIHTPNHASTRLGVITEKCDLLQFFVNTVYMCFETMIDGSASKSDNTMKSSTKMRTAPSGDDSGASEEDIFDPYEIENSDNNDFSSSDEDPGNGTIGGPVLGEWFLRLMEGNEEDVENPRSPGFSSISQDVKSLHIFNLPESAILKKDSVTISPLHNTSLMEFSNKIFDLIDTGFLSSKSGYVKKYIQENLKESSVGKLSTIIKMTCDLSVSCPALLRLLHKLLSSGLLAEESQSAILRGNNISTPGEQLLANSKALSLLFKILFQNQHQAQKEGENHQGTLDFMHGVLDYFKNSMEKDLTFEDINVEVIQMCLFLFHTISENEKEKFFKATIEALAACKEVEKVPVASSRVLLILEYLIHHYSQASRVLFPHVQWNLLTVHLEDPETDSRNSDDKGKSSPTDSPFPKRYLPFQFGDPSMETRPVIYQLMEEECAGVEKVIEKTRERFYEVSDVGLDEKNLDESSLKIDPVVYDVMERCDIGYQYLRNVIVRAMGAGSGLNLMLLESDKDDQGKGEKKDLHVTKGTLARGFLKYNFKIAWRLFTSFVPPVNYVEQSKDDSSQNTSTEILASAYLCGKIEGNSDHDYESFVKLMSLLSSYLEGHFLKDHEETEIIPPSGFPSFINIMVLDSILRELHVVYGKGFEKEMTKTGDDQQTELISHVFGLILKTLTYVAKICRSYVLFSSGLEEDNFEAYNRIMQTQISNWNLPNEEEFLATLPTLPEPLMEQRIKWIVEFRGRIGVDVNSEKSENVIHNYLKALTENDPYMSSLLYLATSLCWIEPEVSALEFLNNDFTLAAAESLIPLQTDLLMRQISSEYSVGLKELEFHSGSEKYQDTLCYHVVNQIYNFIVNVKMESELKERTFSISYLTFLEKLLSSPDSSSIKRALYQFFVGEKDGQKELKEHPKAIKPSYKGINLKYSGEFVSLLLSCQSDSTEQFSYALFSFVCKIFENAVGDNVDPHLAPVIAKMNEMLNVPFENLYDWLKTFTLSIFVNSLSDPAKKSEIPLKLVQYLSHPDAPVDHTLALTILQASLSVPDRYFKTEPAMTDFLTILMTLAEAKQGLGHLDLFKSSLTWLKICKDELTNCANFSKLSQENMNVVNVCELILFYIMDVLRVLHGIKSDDDYKDLEHDLEEDIVVHGSDARDAEASVTPNISTSYDNFEDDSLCNKLCTYTITQKEFMNQHWYHCHTCEMTEGIGVCTICAKVCHKGHDLSYAKYGSFFCDCGAKGSKACRALTKRDPLIENSVASGTPSASSSCTTVIPSASSSATSVPSKKINEAAYAKPSESLTSTAGKQRQVIERNVEREQRQKRPQFCKNLDGCRDELLSYLNTEEGKQESVGLLLDVISDLDRIVASKEYRSTAVRSTAYALETMKNLHMLDKKSETVETLMVPTLGSQEGAFENVKANFTGEQGQTIRQLINTRMIYRVAMCCLSSGRRHHLAVSHEKSKLTILQLSALLKQADASKRKLTLTRLSTTQIPFTIVTLCNNPCNEEVLAVCGLKDCHVLTFSPFGIVNDHLILHPELTAGNYVIKALWLPGSQCEIALVTAKFVKIYDLSQDVLSPSFYFLLPTGKIRDATFIVLNENGESVPSLVVMSSSGYMYTQRLNEESSATHGPFYVTNALTVNHDSLQEKNDQVGGGGVSVYYSHSLQLLFFSYGNGRNFAATLDLELEQVTKLFPITYKISNGKTSNNGNQALYAWNEVVGHPGLLTCFTNGTGTPLAVMVDPQQIQLQEIKASTSKAKIQDIVAVRHSSPGDVERSTMIALCEDGSLRIYLANQETTGFWLRPNLQPKSVFCHSHKHKAVKSSSEGSKVKIQEPVEPVFPVDFFEHCQLINSNDLEFGGDSLLQVYNPNQIKNRLNNQGMYIVSKKTFTIEIVNKSKNMIVTGIRMQVGNRGSDSAPTHIYIGGRYISLGPWLKKPRWFDFPLTREESIQFQNKLLIVCGSSVHPDDYNIVDSIKVYGKTKEAFGWQEEDTKAASMAAATPATKGNMADGKEGNKGTSSVQKSSIKPSFTSDSAGFSNPLDKLLLSCLSSLNCCFVTTEGIQNLTEDMKTQTLALASSLITSGVPHTISRQVKKLMMKILTNQEDYHRFKDKTVLKHAFKYLAKHKEATDTSLKQKMFDLPSLCADEYQIILMELGRIAVRRPSNLSLIDYEKQDMKLQTDMKLPESETETEQQSSQPSVATDVTSHFYCTQMQDLLDILLKFIKQKPKHQFLTPPCLPGILNIESSVQAFVDIVHSVAMTIPSTTDKAAEIYFDLLTSAYTQVSSAARSALIRLLYNPSADVSKSKPKRSNSKSTDTAPSTRSNSPPSTVSSQTVATSAGASVLVLTSNQGGQGFQHSSSYISSHGTAGGTINDDLDDDENEDDSDGDEFEEDEEPPLEEIMIEEDRENGIAPSLQRDEQLRAMQALEEHEAQIDMRSSQNDENGNVASAGASGQSSSAQVHNEMQRLQDLMQAADDPNYFMREDSLDDMMVDSQDDEFGEFEADDEAMVEFAIALSLQQSEAEEQQSQSTSAANTAALGNVVQAVDRLDSSADVHNEQIEQSIAESREEMQQAEESQNLESNSKEKSLIEKVDDNEAIPGSSGVTTSSVVHVSHSVESTFDAEGTECMRVLLLEKLLKRLHDVFKLKRGECSIPYFQVVIMLTKCLDPNKEKQKTLLEELVRTFASDITGEEHKEAFETIAERSPLKEILANIIRCLVILMSGQESSESVTEETSVKENEKSETKTEKNVCHPNTITSIVARILVEYDVVEECFELLTKILQQHWNVFLEKNKGDAPTLTKLLKPFSQYPLPDFSPIIAPQYVKAHTTDIFEAYPELITEWLLHLPYRFKKFYDSRNMALPEKLQPRFIVSPPTGKTFCWILADYMLSTDIPVIKKRVRKALLYLCGSKENYREVRDLHALYRYVEQITETWNTATDGSNKMGAVNLPYDKLISMVTYLDGCSVIAMKRTVNWQKFCLNVLPNYFFLQLCIYMTESVASTALQLLTCAVSVSKGKKGKDDKQDKSSGPKGKEAAESSSKTIAPSSGTGGDQQDTKWPSGDTEMALKLSEEFLTEISDNDLHMFLLRFLLDINTTSIRWNAHHFVLQLFKNTSPRLRTKLVNAMWMLWPSVPDFGRKAVQFIDLLGYLSIENGLDPEKSNFFIDAAFGMLLKQNVLLTNHPNSMLYMQLANYVDFDGYFLESNPCLVCNQPEVPFSTLKLTNVKSDTKYTTTQQIIKLVGSYSLQKLSIKITDIKQTKMVRTVSLYYNNKKVPAIIELKNKPELWHKAKQVVLTQGQTEVKFDLPLPVVATNLMLEFSDFYENVSASTETLQCPRCSASVQATPGICGNCGENVFQCHKCRSINYDEKDPFLCNVCGFSKYAKFDITLIAKPCCAVDTIENEEDRKKMVGLVSVLLEKADQLYYQMLAYKPQLEQLLLHIEKLSTQPLSPAPTAPTTSGNTTQPTSGPSRLPILSSTNQPISLTGGAGMSASSLTNSSVNVHIRQLAQKYCAEAKNSFDELSKIMRTVLASRKEIVDYDQRQKLAMTGGKEVKDTKQSPVMTSATSSQSAQNCYGCAAATAKQCIILLRALATDETCRKRLVSKGLITELVHVSLRRGNVATRKHVQQLIGQLVKNDHEASAELNNILLTRLTSAMRHHKQDLFPASVSSEMSLLVSILGIRDQCWQLRLRTVVQLFQISVKMQSPAVIENITLPCLKMLESKAAVPAGSVVTSNLIKVARDSSDISVDVQAWLASDPNQDFNVWKRNKMKVQICANITKEQTKEEIHEIYLQEKYVRKWRKFVASMKLKKSEAAEKPKLPHHKWLRQMLFCKSSRAVRQAACLIVKSLSENKGKKAQVIDLLTSYLDELSNAGEAAAEFFSLYQEQIHNPQWKVYLAAQDILPFIGKLIEREIVNLLRLEESTLMLDLQQGYALKELTELLSELVRVPYIRQHYKSSLVGTVLNSYLSLRKLVIQRTNIIDDTQELLLELLEDMTTGTESETNEFMKVCIETINKYELSDIRTPQFIFERLANIIFPEENNTNEFFLSLDKDPLQEDFLQGRMVGNPYSSTEPGLGPLMRDVKNKICRDCDLVALLEDDNGMELLVNNKIISLDLPVRDVYNKVWLTSHGEDEAMRVVYRMRGLLGEATEDIVEKLDAEVDNRDEEEVYKMARVLSECGGIEAMLQRLESVENLSHGRQLVDAIMKLMTYVVRLKYNRRYLMKPQLNTLNVLLGTLNLGLQSGESGVPLAEQLLQVMDRVLQDAAADDKTQVFTGDKEKLTLLLQEIDSELVRHHSKVLRGLMRIIPFLCFGDSDLMQMLIDHFKSTLDFEVFDDNHTAEDTVYLDCFCEICTGIEDNKNGYQLKDLIIRNEIVNNALAYISKHVPQHKNFESEDWKQFVARSALPYCLRLLAGLSAKHSPTQILIGQTSIPDLHRLEQVSTQESIGSLAENVLEAISENPDVEKTVKEVRRETRAEKKRLAMAMRQKELGSLGMKTNAKGQVVTQTPLLKQIGDLVEESGLTCIICREGYKFEPKKVLGIYTYSRRCTLEEFENKPRKQQGYSTVSHFNVVHYDCHTAAVRAARGREEWESAMLQNANTKCNGLLPLWGPHVPESAFATCLARHNTYLQEATGYKEPNITSNVHDLKLLLLRFAHERSFSEETGGGGPQSNIHLIPYMLHMAQYVINTTRSSAHEEQIISTFLEETMDTWPESSYSVDGPLFVSALSLFVCDGSKWKSSRIAFLRRVLVLCQTRQSSTSVTTKLKDRVVKPFETYRPFLLFWAMVDLTYTELLQHVPKVEAGETWSSTLANYIRHNDTALLETSEKMMTRFQQEYIPAASLEEFADVAGIYEDIGTDIQGFLKELFESLPE